MTKTSPITVSTSQIRCAVTRPQGSWKWQKRGALSTYEWQDGRWVFIGRSRDFRYDHAVAEADFVGRPTASCIIYTPRIAA